MKLFNIFKPKNKTNLDEWYQLAEFLGLDKNMDEDARSEATYFTCLKILSESIGKLPLKLMRRTKKQGVIEATDHPLYNLLRNRPNKHMTATTFKSTVEQIRNHWGNAFVYISGAGSEIQLIPLDSSQVTIYYDDAKLLSDIPDIFYLYQVGEETYKFSSEEILHLKTSHTFDGITSLSVREILMSTIAGNQKGQALQNAMFENGFTAKAVVQYTGNLKDDSVRNFLSNIENYAKGKVDVGKGLIPIPLGSTFTPLNGSLGDNEFLEIKKYSALQIAAAFGIKPTQINDYTKASYASSESQNLGFLVDTLMVIVNQYEEELNYKLLSDKEIRQGYFFKFNTAALLRADIKTQIDTLTRGISMFLYTPNEARAYLDLDAKEDGDCLIGNGSTIRLHQVGSQWSTLVDNDVEEKEETKGGDE